MKNKLFLLAAIFCIATKAFATTHTISVGGISFTPSTLTVHPGDVIMWVWSDGSHTTTSTSVPATAGSWDNPINSTSTSFSYTPTVLGTYQFKCTFHASMGMVGTITVVSATGVATVNKPAGFLVFPNPASENLNIQFQNPSMTQIVTLTDMNGKEVIKKTFNTLKETNLDLSDIPDGTYIVRVQENSKVSSEQQVVVHH